MYAVHRTIISATFIGIESITLFLIGLASIAFFLVILSNKYTTIIALIFITVFAMGIFLTYEDIREQYPEVYEMFLMVTGRLPYRSNLGRMVTWIISILLGFAIVVFMLHQFNFYMLFMGGAAVFIFTWLPGLARNERAFLVFLVAFCLILIRKTSKSTKTALSAVPLCIVVILFANAQMPQESEFFVPRYITRSDGTRMNFVRDFFYEMFNPAHFSFQTTGFSGAGGRLGGSITPNNRPVMTVYAPGITYLTGAISNTYTGDRWLPTLQEGDINTHGLSPSHFEMLETAAALIRYATHTNSRPNIPMASMGIPPSEVRRIPSRHFQVLGVAEVQNFEERYFTGFVPGIDYEMRFEIIKNTDEHGWVEYDLDALFDLRTFENIPTENIRINVRIYDEHHWLQLGAESEAGDSWELRNNIEEIAHDYFMQHVENDTVWFNFYTTRTSRWCHNQFYWHTYLPFDTLKIMQGTNRTGTIFTPPRATEIWFAQDSFNYASYVEVSPMGTKQTPGFMSRGAGYHMNFLNVDTRLSFIERLLRQTNVGVYERHAIREEIQMPVFLYGVQPLIGLTPCGQLSSDPQPAVNFPPADVEEIFALLDYYIGVAGAAPNGAINFNYVRNSAHFMKMLDSFSATILAQYALEVREHFMAVPEIVPPRVHELTHEIISGTDNDFDRVIAIRDFLLQFPYTFTPVPVPRGVCFVDFFLFEGQEGYCTYFASAMAIMSRIAGVPSRYVEGFVLPPTGTPVTVTNRMAHAWVEVYLEGFGWLIVEATPTYAFLTNPDTPLPEGALGDNDMPDRIQNMIRDFGAPNRPDLFGPRPEGGAREPQPEPVQEEEPSALVQWLPFAAAAFFAFIIVATVALRFIQVKRKHYRAEKLPPNEQLITYYNGITDIISYYKTPPSPDETPQAYGLRYGKRFAFHSDTVFFRDLIALYYKAKYSPVQISQSEIGLMKEAYHSMLYLLRITRHPWTFIYLHYVRRIGEINCEKT